MPTSQLYMYLRIREKISYAKDLAVAAKHAATSTNRDLNPYIHDIEYQLASLDGKLATLTDNSQNTELVEATDSLNTALVGLLEYADTCAGSREAVLRQPGAAIVKAFSQAGLELFRQPTTDETRVADQLLNSIESQPVLVDAIACLKAESWIEEISTCRQQIKLSTAEFFECHKHQQPIVLQPQLTKLGTAIDSLTQYIRLRLSFTPQSNLSTLMERFDEISTFYQRQSIKLTSEYEIRNSRKKVL